MSSQEEIWLCVDGHGDERIFPCEPYRQFPNMNLDVNWGQRWTTGGTDVEFKYGVLLPKGTIKHLIGIDMTFSDKPIQINKY